MTTTVLKLKLRTPTRCKHQRLLDYQNQFTRCVRFHLKHILRLQTTNQTVIHHETYQLARTLFDLPAHTTQQARDKAIASYQGYLNKRKKDKRTNPPAFNKPLPIRLAVGDFRLVDSTLRLSVKYIKYLWLPLIVPAHHQELIAKSKICVSELIYKGGQWYLHLALKREDVPMLEVTKSTPRFGLDMGLVNIVTLTGLGLVKFFSGKQLRHVRDRYFKYRQALQKKGKLGMIKRSKGRESNWVRDMNHKLSRQIVDIVAAAGGVLYVENLRGIRDRIKRSRKLNRMLAGWPFGQLLEFIIYKAKLVGVQVVLVDPRHTSQCCSSCGFVSRRNRSTQSKFQCRSCKFELHADLNAARNIAAGGVYSIGVGGKSPP